jgi:hypothetical protein
LPRLAGRAGAASFSRGSCDLVEDCVDQVIPGDRPSSPDTKAFAVIALASAVERHGVRADRDPLGFRLRRSPCNVAF